MALAGLSLAVLPGLIWVVELEFCARAESANAQEKTPISKTSPRTSLDKNVMSWRNAKNPAPGKDYWPEAEAATLPSFTPT